MSIPTRQTNPTLALFAEEVFARLIGNALTAFLAGYRMLVIRNIQYAHSCLRKKRIYPIWNNAPISYTDIWQTGSNITNMRCRIIPRCAHYIPDCWRMMINTPKFIYRKSNSFVYVFHGIISTSIRLPYDIGGLAVKKSKKGIPSTYWIFPPRSIQTHSEPKAIIRVPKGISGGQATALSIQSCQRSPEAMRLTHSPLTKLEQFGPPVQGV